MLPEDEKSRTKFRLSSYAARLSMKVRDLQIFIHRASPQVEIGRFGEGILMETELHSRTKDALRRTRVSGYMVFRSTSLELDGLLMT